MNIETLHQLFLDCKSVSTDTRKIKEGDLFFALKGGNFNGNAYAQNAIDSGANYAIIDDREFLSSNKKIVLVKDTLKTLQQLATYHRDYLKIPIIALTGSNGKTTTKELINAVLFQKFNTAATVGNLNNHIGVPLTLLSFTKGTEIGIVEMGANHQKEIAFLCNIAKPDFGLITNFGKAHLEGFGGFEGVIKGKSEMYDYLIANNKTIFVNTNDAIQIEKSKNANTFTFGNSTSKSDVITEFIEAQPFVTSKYNNLTINSQLIGDYNFTNIAVAIAIGNYFKVNDSKIKHAIESYIPTNNRSQVIVKDTNKIILDAYNANPTSMYAALLNFEKQTGHKIAILGDMFELGDEAIKEHQKITDLVVSLNIDTIYLIGKNFNLSQTSASKATQYKSLEAFKDNIKPSSLKNASILIKGSRGMALERVLKFL